MTKIILCGYSGKMGHAIINCVSDRDDCKIVAGVSRTAPPHEDFPVFTCLDSCNITADVVIDFSNPSLLNSLLKFGKNSKTPIVIATTGYSDEQKQQITSAAADIPIFFTYNMSIGVNLLTVLAQKATQVLGNNFDIEIVEKHHNQKLDAPSGTALMLAESISECCKSKPEYIYSRHDVRQKRSKNEIGIHSVRGGTIVGEHEVIFAGMDEVITLSHTAYSKGVFAVG
ncbi:MAG: 4-hydroxy-tetrahydrodipicolinate reductase, partial [Oscillospiraceae bacterium]